LHGAEGENLARYVLVGLGGFLGAVARYWLGAYVGSRFGSRFPYGTFVINMSGCFLIGIVITVLDQRTHWSAGWRYLVPIGFIGAYTTFSTFEFETLRSVQDGAFRTAALNVVLSVAIGLAAVWLGMTAANAVLNVGRAESSIPAPENVTAFAPRELGAQEFLTEPEN
jgi:CrcB protein